MTAASWTVSGPGVDRNGYLSGDVALSAAITFALAASGDDATFYARDAAGETYGYAERAPGGVIRVVRLGKRP